jgi:N-acetylmuramic acid 6-phosphate etherase
VAGALEHSKAVGATTVSLSCNANSLISQIADHAIEVVVGPEVLAGSTRLKAGTAQKMVLNMISTITMVKAGKTYGNLMVDVIASNSKLRKRATGIVATITSLSPEQSVELLQKHNWKVKSAIVGALVGLDPASAEELLDKSGGFLSVALGESL